MKNVVKILIVCLPTLMVGCPYTFINDTQTPIILAEKIDKAYLAAPQQEVRIEAPMSDEHDHDHEQGHDWNGHAAIYVYIRANGEYHLKYKIKERACGANSVVKASELAAMVTDEKKAGRFEITLNNQERKEKKQEQLAEKGKRTEQSSEEVEQIKSM